MKTINIKGSPYVTVNERVKYLHENYEGFSIRTEYQFLHESQMFICKAIIDTIEGQTFEGVAQEVITSRGITKDKALEKCQTTAVGRALAFMGIGIDASIASADEIADVANGEAAEDWQIRKIESLLHNSILTEELREAIEGEMFSYTKSRANKCIAYLTNNQQGILEKGSGSVRAKDINKHVESKS